MSEKKYGRIEKIETVDGFTVGNFPPMNGKDGSRLGIGSMISLLGGGMSMDGYRVVAGGKEILVLIDDSQSCCENWGYLSSDDDLQSYVGANLREIVLTDTALKSLSTAEELQSLDAGGVQFVTFKTSRGDFQLAVYNGHNGYYGHGIIIAENGKIILNSAL